VRTIFVYYCCVSKESGTLLQGGRVWIVKAWTTPAPFYIYHKLSKGHQMIPTAIANLKNQYFAIHHVGAEHYPMAISLGLRPSSLGFTIEHFTILIWGRRSQNRKHKSHRCFFSEYALKSLNRQDLISWKKFEGFINPYCLYFEKPIIGRTPQVRTCPKCILEVPLEFFSQIRVSNFLLSFISNGDIPSDVLGRDREYREWDTACLTISKCILNITIIILLFYSTNIIRTFTQKPI
jgi:hypothetical protein